LQIKSLIFENRAALRKAAGQNGYNMRERLSSETYIQGILAADTMLLSRAITVLESSLPEDEALAEAILSGILPHTGNAIRIGITGIPGVGKSTFIEAFGGYLTSLGKRIAVLAVDPTSKISGGSILGDKTRMEKLSGNPLAYIRPSPAGAALGGVTHSTRDTMLACEAAGFDVILIETVGVGQSEMMVRSMTDFFLLLTIAGAGDELQGIKRGITEMIDAVLVNKADGSGKQPALQTAAEFRNALHLMTARGSGMEVSVLTCSALENEGIAAVWETIGSYIQKTSERGFLQQNRQVQNVAWLHETIENMLIKAFYQKPEIKNLLREVEQAIAAGGTLPKQAAQVLLTRFLSGQDGDVQT
jgi:LAO/AO transport system kinase